MFQNGSQWIWEKFRNKYRMLKYSRDIDSAVATQGTVWWIDALNWPVLEPWRAYTVGNQTGGWVEERDGLTFVVINGAGHMVPYDKPEVIYHVIDNWINNEPI